MNEPTMNESEQRIKQLQVLKDIALTNPGSEAPMEAQSVGGVPLSPASSILAHMGERRRAHIE